jgi:hypothetical protein
MTGRAMPSWRCGSKGSIRPPVALGEILDEEIGHSADQVSTIDSVASECGNESGSVDLAMATWANGNTEKIVPRRLSPFSAHEMVGTRARLITKTTGLHANEVQVVLRSPSPSLAESHG